MNKSSDEMRDLTVYLQPGGGCSPEQLERWADAYDALAEENYELRKSLNNLTDGLWTQMEIDAGKWRGQEMAALLRDA